MVKSAKSGLSHEPISRTESLPDLRPTDPETERDQDSALRSSFPDSMPNRQGSASYLCNFTYTFSLSLLLRDNIGMLEQIRTRPDRHPAVEAFPDGASHCGALQCPYPLTIKRATSMTKHGGTHDQESSRNPASSTRITDMRPCK